MEILKYIEEKKKFYTILLNFLDKGDDNETFHNKERLMEIFQNQEYANNKEELGLLLRLIIKLSKNHFRTNNFIEKIEQILFFIKDKIKQTYSNSEIFQIFQNDKLILLFIIENDFIEVDETIARNIFKKRILNYIQFFLPEIKPFVKIEKVKQIEDELLGIDENFFLNFSEKRKMGENESYICQLIRKDSIEEFVSFVNRNNISLNKTIKPSIFETNIFLIKNEPTLIEYSAFYGSIQIFQFLRLNDVKLNERLFLYSIHGRNPEIIHILEENKIGSNSNEMFSKCLEESIKCHHNEFASYFKDNFIDQNQNFNKSVISYCFHYNNYEFLPTNLNELNSYLFYYSCQFNYLTLVKIFIKTKRFDLNMKIISIFLLN